MEEEAFVRVDVPVDVQMRLDDLARVGDASWVAFPAAKGSDVASATADAPHLVFGDPKGSEWRVALAWPPRNVFQTANRSVRKWGPGNDNRSAE